MEKGIARSLKKYIHLWGWKTPRKLVVFESDDWGSERMPSKKVFYQLKKQGIPVEDDPYCRYDTRASNQDLDLLYEIMDSFRDHKGNPPAFTVNTIMGNPDFKKISLDDFKAYSYVASAFPGSFYEGIKNGFIKPQFHGREHLNVKQWMKALRQGDRDALVCFHHGVYGFPTTKKILNRRYDYMANYDVERQEDYDLIEQSISQGLKIFGDTFHQRPASAIAPCYIWDTPVENCYHQNGIRYIQGHRFQKIPVARNGSYRKKFHFTGQKNKFSQLYLVRNCFFEPSFTPDEQNVENCLKRMHFLFKYNRPVIMATHRVHYIGGLDVQNRDKSLRLFHQLLTRIRHLWPDIEYLTSEALGHIISMKNQEPHQMYVS